MKYTGVSKLAALITWFRMPRRYRRQALAGARAAMLVFICLFLATLAVFGLVRLIGWALEG
jgi:hypothetical protein